MKKPIVSIIMPVYNSNKQRLTESIESVLGQTYTDFELIIINDASTNDIEETIIQFVEKDSRIQYIKNLENLQLTKTLNKGISLSQGTYIARMDDDDIWCDNEKLEKQIQFMEENKDVGMCGTSVIHINEQGVKISATHVPESDQEIRSKLMRFNQFAHASIVFRKDVIEKVGNYNPDYNGAEDYEFWLRIGTHFKLANLPDYSFKYRHNNQGVSAKKSRTQGWFGLKIAYKYRKNYPHFWLYCLPRLIVILLPRDLITTIFKYTKKI